MTESLLDEADPPIRRGAAEFVGGFARVGVDHYGLARVLDDPDDGVRETLLSSLEGSALTDAIRDAVRQADWEPRPWVCLRCEAQNAAEVRKCTSCERSEVDLQRPLAKLGIV